MEVQERETSPRDDREALIGIAQGIAGLAVLCFTFLTFLAWVPAPWTFLITGPLLWVMARVAGRGWRWPFIVFASIAAWLAGSGAVWMIAPGAPRTQSSIGTAFGIAMCAFFILTTRPKES